MEEIVLLTVLVSWGFVFNTIYFIVRRYGFIRRFQTGKKGKLRRAVVIESVKGMRPAYAGHVAALLKQNYPDYRIIFCLEDILDPAFGYLIELFEVDRDDDIGAFRLDGLDLMESGLGGSGLLSVDIVIAGKATICSQKIFNQLRAYECLESEDALMAWVDADTELTDSWLNDLLFPIQEKDHAASTGYRCLVPAGGDWTSSLISVINASVLTLFGEPWRNGFWGGSMAMTRAVFECHDIPRYVGRCFSDDESLSAMLKEKGVPIYFAYTVLPPDRVEYTFSEMVAFGRRQYFCLRFYYSFHLFMAFVLLGGFMAVFSYLMLAVSIRLDPVLIRYALVLAVAVISRGILRFGLVRYGLRRREYGLTCLFLETLGTPLVQGTHLLILVSALFGRTVTWAGITYKIEGPFHVQIL